LEEAGVGYREDYVVRGMSDAQGGFRSTRALLDLDDPPQAIFCFNDRVAMGGYHAARERGLRIPEDVSFFGFDNQVNVADGLFPGLTTVALPHYEMGAWGVRTLVAQIERPELHTPSQISLACPLVIRESIAAPAGFHQRLPGGGETPAERPNVAGASGVRQLRVLP
jgi:LacI family transcriptional regulator